MKTSELIGPALDWAVAKCEGVEMKAFDGNFYYRGDDDVFRYMIGFSFSPSTTWEQGGSIIEREGINLYFNPEDADVFEWHAEDRSHAWYLEGSTPLIAAMRCYVASKLGDEVKIPKELK